MRYTAGFTLVAAVGLAALRLGTGPGTAAVQAAGEAMRPAAAGKRHNPRPQVTASGYIGGCTAFEGAGEGGAERSGEAKDPDKSAAAEVLERFNGDKLTGTVAPEMHFAIALAPDPVHTNLSLIFDREMVTLQQAAQDEGYTYDSSWLPWQGEGRGLSSLSDRLDEAELTDQREACPGVLLFRHSVSDKAQTAGGGAPDAFARGLIVFVVGEQPTGGVNDEQWSNAVHWLASHAAPSAAAAGSEPPKLRIMGPTFSGSLVSLERELAKVYAENNGQSGADAAKLRERFPAALVLSGSVRGCSSIRWFEGRLAEARFRDESAGAKGGTEAGAAKGRVYFGSFQENDAVQIDRFLRYMSGQGSLGKDTAILAEDETAYANPYFDPSAMAAGASSCEFPYGEQNRPLRVSYPRDISALRKAYEKQSVFNGGESGGAGGRNAHPILQSSDDVATSGGSDTRDTIPTYSGQLNPVAQEAELYGVVSYLRTHHTRYLVLRCSNPLDFLFLTRFFHRAYPEGRIVTVGADLLFRREIDSTEFRGVMALSSYPLLPRDQHWTALLPAEARDSEQSALRAVQHTHRIFEDQYQQGEYIATRYLLSGHCAGTDDAAGPVSRPGCEVKPGVPGVADPFWLSEGGLPREPTSAPTWLSVVGRDGYWPVAVLNDRTVERARLADTKTEPKPPLSTIVKLHASEGMHYDLDRAYLAGKADRHEELGRQDDARFSKAVLLNPSLSWKIVTALAMFLLVYQAIALGLGPEQAATRLMAGFRRIGSQPQACLTGLNSAFGSILLLAPLSVLLCVYGKAGLGTGGLGTGASSVWASLWFAVGAILIVAGLMVARGIAGGEARTTVLYYAIALGCLVWVATATLETSANGANRFPIALRILHPTSGVSPLVPAVLLFGGFYLWSWQAMAGNMLLSGGLPILPRMRTERVALGWKGILLRLLKRPETEVHREECRLGEPQYRISHEMGRRILHVAAPFSLPIAVLVPSAALCLCVVLYFHSDLPLLTLEGKAFTLCFNLALLAALLLTTAEASRLSATWRDLHRLLIALNQTRLRRTFSRLRAIDTHSLWAVSGNARRIQSLFFAHQMEAAHRLLQADKDSRARGTSRLLGREERDRLRTLRIAVATGRRFARRNAGRIEAGSRWDEPVHRLGGKMIRELFADAVAETMNTVLLPAWGTETESLSIDEKCQSGDPETEGSGAVCMELSQDEKVRAAEEFVCFHYIAFIQNILARMRTMTLSMAMLFVAVCFAISFYPFVPRTEIGIWMIANLAVIGASVIFVYVAMERDATLSYIANTRPGHLSSAFWIKSAAFLAGPVIGILTTQFPAIADSVLAWVQPGLDAISK